MRRRRVLTRLVVAALAATVVVLAYQATRTALSLRTAETASERLQAQLGDGDVEGAAQSARELQRSAGTAHHHSDGVLWRLATWLPWIGDDAAAVRDLSAALDQVAQVAPDGVDVLEAAADGSLRTADGAVDLGVVTSLQAPLTRLQDASQRASDTVADVDPERLVGELSGRAQGFLDRLEALTSGTRGAATAVEVLPELLGGDGARTYLLVVQNNAEIRSTGGLPGSVAVLEAEGGRVRLGFQGAAKDFQGPPGSYGDLLPGEREVFGPLLVRDFRDAGFTPDFPRAASLWVRHAEAARDRSFDGVLSLDPVTLAQVLRATGPIEAAGEQLRPDTAVRQLLFEPYARFEDPARQDLFFQAAASGILDALLQAEGDQAELVRVLAEATSQRRLQFWTPDAAVQDRLDDYAVAGALPRSQERPEVGFYLDDATEAKIQFFGRHDAEITSRGCVDGRQLVEARMSLESRVPEPVEELPPYVTGNGSKAPRGDSRMLLRMFAPEGGELTGLEIDGRSVPVSQVDVYDRQVSQRTIQLTPGQQKEVVAQFTSGEGRTGDPRLQWTPSVAWGPTQDVANSRCE